jgi:hypothetical protein
MLNFNGSWRFDSPGEVPQQVITVFSDLIGRVASQGPRQSILEHFKSYFAGAGGSTSSWSSSESWAESDLYAYMRHSAENAPLFIEAFYDGCESLRATHPEYAIPDVNRINRVLAESDVGYYIQPLNFLSRNPQMPVVVPERMPSLTEQAIQLIHKSLSDSEQLLAQGMNRQAVQEILWLLETVSTAFQGLDVGAGTVQGKYFNKIADDLRKHQKGKTLEQVLAWMTSLHGYLSSPTGGGVRHGVDLKAGIALHADEARLFCNLIRSYIRYLVAEHGRLSGLQA